MTEQEYAIRPNKSQQKREIKVLNKLGQELVKMAPSELAKFPISEQMSEALLEAKRLTKGALQRQLRRIASLMMKEDVDAIRFELEKLKMPSREQVAEHHLMEQWRDSLIAGDEALLTQIIDNHPQVDRQRIRQLVRSSKLERTKNKPPKSARALFRYLTELRRETSAASQDEVDTQSHDSHS